MLAQNVHYVALSQGQLALRGGAPADTGNCFPLQRGLESLQGTDGPAHTNAGDGVFNQIIGDFL